MSFSSANAAIGRRRWTICALVFAATTINYLDRNILGILKPILAEDGVFGILKAEQERNYSTVVICFQIAYALGLLFVGKIIDKIGTKSGYAYSLIGWSLAAIGHAFGHHTWSFGIWRAALGFTEAGNFPAANKTVTEWFPKKERAFATGLYNSGANVGSIIAPLCVPWIAETWGWEWAFILTGAVGLIWLAFWYALYDTPAKKLADGKLSQEEYDFIHSDADEQEAEKAEISKETISWAKLVTYRQTWAVIVGKFLTDPIWWFFLFWLPSFLTGQNAIKVKEYMAVNPTYTGNEADIPGVITWTLAVAAIYTFSTVGSIFGGWLPKQFMNQGMDPNKARKLAMLIFAFLPLSVLLASKLGEINTWLAVITIAVACAGHAAWSANLFTTISDMFPKKAIASVTGLGGMAGSIGGILIARVAGLILEHYTKIGNVQVGYGILFVVCGTAYVTAWVIMNVLAPKFKQIAL